MKVIEAFYVTGAANLLAATLKFVLVSDLLKGV